VRLASVVLLSLVATPWVLVRAAEPLRHTAKVERSLPTKATHSFEIAVPAASFIRVFVTLHSGAADIVVADEGGAPILTVRSREWGLGNIPISWRSTAGGSYTLSLTGTATARYTAWFDELTAEDPEHVQQLIGERALITGEALRAEGRAESFRAAAARFEEASRAFAKTRDRAGEAIASGQAGLTWRQTGDAPRALAAYDHAVALARTANDRISEGRYLRAIAEIHRLLGNVNEAFAMLQQALGVIGAASDTSALPVALLTLGQLHDSVGEWQPAIDYKERAIELQRAAGNTVEQSVVLESLATTHSRLGNHAEAMRLMAQARAMSDGRSEASRRTLFANAGVVYASAGDFTTAMSFYEQALDLSRRAGAKTLEAANLNNIGYAIHARGDAVGALDYFERALPLFQGGGDLVGEASCLRNIGRARASTGDRVNAVAPLEASLAISRRLRDRRNEALTLFSLARVERDDQRLDAAATHIETALDIAESLRAGVLNQTLRTMFLASVHSFYELAIDVRVRQHERDPRGGFAEQAFALSERARARSFLDLVGESGGSPDGADRQLVVRETELQRLITTKSDRLVTLLNTGVTGTRITAAEEELEAILAQHADVQGRIRASDPRSAVLTKGTPIGAVRVQQALLDAETVLLAFTLGDERSYAWTLTRRSVEVTALPPRQRIEAAARRFYESASVRSDQPVLDAELRAVVLRPLPPAAGRRIVIIPDGALHYVPFAALIEDREIVYAPSASVVDSLRADSAAHPRAKNGVAVFADPVFATDDPRVASTTRGSEPRLQLPRLIGSRREARAILSLVPAADRFEALGFDASREAVMNSDLRRYRVVHLATHGIWDSARPELSGIALSLVDQRGRAREGFLRFQDVMQLELNAELVTLSACQTALGRAFKGEGLVGIMRGFMYAGAPRVLASLWKVDDAATAALMEEFYRRLLGPRRLPPAAALREAQNAIKGQPRWRSPHYWSGFILQGDWQ
jgi:CHAT domain-containing protein/Tfp pilus assembly protein PilF